MRPRILAVDDEPRNLKIVTELFGDDSELCCVTSGDQALGAFFHFRPDVVLLDVMMPGIDGYEVCRRIRNVAEGQFTKILFLTGKSALSDRLGGYSDGADDFIVKPFSPDELQAKVKVFLRLAQTERALRLLNEDLERQVVLRSEELVKASRLRDIGLHAAEIVHNLKNPISAFKMGLYLLSQQVKEKDVITRMENSVRQLEEIVRSILTHGHDQSELQVVAVDLPSVIENEIKLLEMSGHFHDHIQVNTLIDRKVTAVLGRTADFSQVMGNVLKNALDAMHDSDRCKLTIKCYQDRNFVKVSVSDTGCGMQPEQIARIFEPFYTTKPVVPENASSITGTGLGLSSVKRLLDAYGGNIHVDSSFGEGTTVTLVFVAFSHAS